MEKVKEWKRINPLVMVVLDGFGVTMERKGNAIFNAETPVIDSLWNDYPHTILNASGESVGLPWGEYGNSEVGHITLGVGSVIKQSMSMIKESIESGEFFDNPVLTTAIDKANNSGKAVHIAGIFSPAGIHGHTDYFDAVLRMCQQRGAKNVFLHLFTDGRDVPPKSFDDFYRRLKNVIAETGLGVVSSIAGRFYAMDRISRWDRTNLTYLAMTGKSAETAASVDEAIANSYAKNIYDENIMPVMIVDKVGKPVGPVKDGDCLIFINHRRDRIRQIASFFASDEKVIEEERKDKKMAKLTIVSMVFYELINMGVKIAFTPEEINRSSGELTSLPKLLSDNMIRQYHIAETEKYPHISYFFNGGDMVVFDGEERKKIPSPKVRGYDEKPEMSLYEVTGELIAEIERDKFGFCVVNFANPDMVGHTGSYEAGVKAVEVVDKCLGEVVRKTLAKQGTVIVTADHGNCEEMINPISGNISKEHTSNPVPFLLIDDRFKFTRSRKEKFADAGNSVPNGLLADVSPTILELVGLSVPDEMNGVSLMDAIN